MVLAVTLTNKVLGPRTDNNLGVVLHRHNIESPIKTQQNRYSFVTERAPHQDFVHVLFKRPSPPPATAPPLWRWAPWAGWAPSP